MSIFESVPNISEGRDRKKIVALLDTLRPIKELKILDHSSDTDHNRSVFTYIGTRAAVLSAGLALVKKAAEILDIRAHEGAHPRLGAVDVLPIVPVYQAEMSEAAALAHELGGAIQKLGVPVIFYEKAALDPADKNLADVRRKSYNNAHQTAGVVCVGARNYLVAYNIDLATQDAAIAKKIAGQIRERGGGLPGVKALGLYLASRGCAQVSLNLCAPELTGPEKVLAYVKNLAEGAGVKIKGTELIGLLPETVAREARKLAGELHE
ncbi:MAG: glutamate formiminotransferase [Candidatus Margulisbacteria bacterium]|jgi:glutamate formiminotransferase|nr:glutamate formiminotransferase [Candidatus Margulisiibacteriota bacterium]